MKESTFLAGVPLSHCITSGAIMTPDNVLCWMLEQEMLSWPSLPFVTFNPTRPSFIKSKNDSQVYCYRCIYLNYSRSCYKQGSLHSSIISGVNFWMLFPNFLKRNKEYPNFRKFPPESSLSVRLWPRNLQNFRTLALQ